MDVGKSRYPIRRARLTSGDHGNVYDAEKVDAFLKEVRVRRVRTKPPTYRCSQCMNEWQISESASGRPVGWWICPKGCNIAGRADAVKRNRRAKAGRPKGVGLVRPKGGGRGSKAWKKTEKQKKQKLITGHQARRALYLDFEGRTDEDPVLMGVLFDDDPGGDGSWVVIQAVFDEACSRADTESDTWCETVPLEAALAWLVAFSDAEERRIVSWSRHDHDVIKRVTGGSAFRYRNAIPTSKRWRHRSRKVGKIADDGTANNTLEHYEKLIAYERPPERFGVGESIQYIRDRQSVTPGVRERWNTILSHNLHDLLAMREVVFTSLRLE